MANVPPSSNIFRAWSRPITPLPKWRLIWILILLLAKFAAAQSESKVFRLVPKSDPDLKHGKVAVVKGSTDSKGQQFLVENLTVRTPVEVHLLAQQPRQKMVLQLYKYPSEPANLTGTTDGDGICILRVRTEGEMHILIKSEAGVSPYYLVLWKGDEIVPALPNVFVPGEK